ncbi:MAG TPA: hypothetical protein VJ725_22735 [Thermoanaerobaculia bacterium]|nr:hypothetical protein [Thermoanaerobaculia bacterium]
MTTLVQIGSRAGTPAAGGPEAGTLTQVVLGSGGVKIGTFRGQGLLEGWDEPPRLVFEGAGPEGLWLLVDPGYVRSLKTLTAGSAVPRPGGERAPGLASPAAGDRVLVQLKNHLTYSGLFFGRVDNPFSGGRGGSLLGFEARPRLLYWLADGLVRRLRVTIPGSLAGARAPLGLFREER